MMFPNRAGDKPDTDDILREELRAAGIPTLHETDESVASGRLDKHLRSVSGEVKTCVIGSLYGWSFTRQWYYWAAQGPGIDVISAEKLHASHGKEVRVNGDAGAPSPREAFKGLGCGCYHVDTPGGLKALADTIKQLVAGNG